jgi:hypothetical protein
MQLACDGMQIPPAGREQSERIARVRFFASRTTHIYRDASKRAAMAF